MNPTFKTVARPNIVTANRHKNCFLCDARLQIAHIRNIDQIFYVDPKNGNEQSKTLATILSDVLEQNIEEPNVHSKIVCRKCQQQCIEYDRLSAQLQELRQTITNNFNVTADKYNLKVIDMDLDQNYETIHESDDNTINNMYAIESVDSTIGEVFNNENDGAHEINKGPQMKKVMLIKTENGSNPFFAISGMGEGIDDDQAIHTVSKENVESYLDILQRNKKQMFKLMVFVLHLIFFLKWKPLGAVGGNQ